MLPILKSLFVAIFVCVLMVATVSTEQNFAVTDKVGQGNFAYAKLFAFGEDGSLYRLTKRSAFALNDNNKFAFERQQGRFAARKDQPSEFAFAFAKRSVPTFAKSAELYELDETESPSSFAFAKRSKFAFASPTPKFA